MSALEPNKMNLPALHRNGTVTYYLPGTRIRNTCRQINNETLRLMQPVDRDAIREHLLRCHPELNQHLKRNQQ